MRKIFKIIAVVLIAAGLVSVLGFVMHRNNHEACKGIQISISRSDPWDFLIQQDVMAALSRGGVVTDTSDLAALDCEQIENAVKKLPAVANAEVYKTIGGYLRIDCTERHPIARIITQTGASAYVDSKGFLMPTLRNATARVPVFTGNIVAPLKMGISVLDSTYENTELPGIYKLANFVRSDSLWQAQVQQVYVDENKEFEVVPRVGSHTIVVGDADNLDTKFQKLKLLYFKGFMPDDWNRYQKIDLTFKDQIVCTKK